MKNLTEAQKVVIALKLAKDLNLSRYTSGTFARDAEGQSISSVSPNACQWCAVGARTVACRYVGLKGADRCRVVDIMHKAGLLPSVNDDRPDLLRERWDRAVALAESEAVQ